MTNEIIEQSEQVSSIENSNEEQQGSWAMLSVEDFDLCELNNALERASKLAQETIWAGFDYSI